MPTPINTHNTAYNRLYKFNNALQAGQINNGVEGDCEINRTIANGKTDNLIIEEALKGSIDLPAFPPMAGENNNNKG